MVTAVRLVAMQFCKKRPKAPPRITLLFPVSSTSATSSVLDNDRDGQTDRDSELEDDGGSTAFLQSGQGREPLGRSPPFFTTSFFR